MDGKELDKHIDELCEIFLELKSVAQCRAFLDDLCTYKEIEQMAKRVYAARLFLDGNNTYNDITEATELSSATVSRVSRALSHGSGGYKSALKGEGKL